MLKRAYAFLHVKGVDGDKRVITGTATTPTPDRMGDVVEPLGVQFKNPLPLLLYHNSQKPVGWVKFQKPTKDGIEFEAHLPTIDEPGTVRDRIEEAWTSIKTGLLAGVSIGFRSIEEAFNKETMGFRFLKTEVLELSLVAVPAQPDARIDTIKSLDIGLAATGTEAAVDLSTKSGVSDRSRVVVVTRKDARNMKTYTEKITAFTAEKTAKLAKMNELGGEDGSTMDAAQQESFDTLVKEVESIDAHLSRLETLEKMNKDAAKPVAGDTQEEAAASRGKQTIITVRENLEPGMEFCRAVLCKAASFLEFTKGNPVSAIEIAKQRYPDSQGVHKYLMHQKTAVAGGTTTDANFAAALLAPSQVLEADFLAFLRPMTILGKFGTNGIPSLRRVPFNVTIQSQTTGASASWVGEGKAKPVTKFNTTTTSLLFTKIAAISVITEELARFSRPGAEGVVRDELARAVIERMDTDFVDPAKAVSSGVNPASITNGLVAQTSAGTSAANVLTDLQNLINPFILNKYDVSDLVIIMPNSLALVLSLMQNSLGQASFPGLGVNGGRLAGLPVITSQYVASGASFGNFVVVLSAGNIALADDGKVTVDASREASIEMSDAPGGDATAGTGASVVSMWQTNSIALRAEREINWKKLRSTAVVYMDDVNWGSIGSPV